MKEEEIDDLKVASEMQHALLPRHYPTFPSSAKPEDSAVRFCHYFEPNGQVGGDLYNVYPLGQTQVGVFICDVMGHGIRAALGSGIILGLLRQLAEETRDPARMLTRLNHQLSEILAYLPEGIFTTAFFMVIDAEDGSVTYANAGHPPPLVIKEKTNTVEFLEDKNIRSGTALALMPHSFYQNATYKLDERDSIMMYTDGITEVINRNNEDFGEARLLKFAQHNTTLDARKFMKKLIKELRVFSGEKIFPDDTCMVWTQLAHYMK